MVMATAVETAAPRRGGNWERVAAGTVVFMAALGLVGLGGCFLVGVMTLVTNDFSQDPRPPLSAGESTLLIILYVLAFTCFAGAAVLVCVALAALGKVLGEKRQPGVYPPSPSSAPD
jgi:hypothetical protein